MTVKVTAAVYRPGETKGSGEVNPTFVAQASPVAALGAEVRPDQQVRRGRDRQRRHPAAGELTAELAARGCERRKPQREVRGQERRAVNRQRVSSRMVAQDRHALRDRDGSLTDGRVPEADARALQRDGED